MRKLFVPLIVVAAAMFAHAPAGMIMLISAFVCGIASALYLWRRKPSTDHVAMAAAELTALFGLIVIVTGPLWARKAWGIWWDWDPRLTMSFVGWMIAVSYLFVRKYGGPGSDKLGAALAVFGAANVPFIYVSVNVWRTLHPKTSVVPKLPPLMAGPFWFSFCAMFVLYLLLLNARINLE